MQVIQKERDADSGIEDLQFARRADGFECMEKLSQDGASAAQVHFPDLGSNNGIGPRSLGGLDLEQSRMTPTGEIKRLGAAVARICPINCKSILDENVCNPPHAPTRQAEGSCELRHARRCSSDHTEAPPARAALPRGLRHCITGHREQPVQLHHLGDDH
jgi:hypothetical protein